jgi:hypothetical protein
MRSSLSSVMLGAALATLPACSLTDVHETVHRSIPAASLRTVHVDNSVGGVTMRAWNKPMIDVVAVKSARSVDDLKNIAINVESRGSVISITTVNNGAGDFWNGGGVEYTIRVPKNLSVDITNGTGGIRISGVEGNIMARTTTGGMQADLGRVAGKRNIDMRVTTGGIDVTIARGSSATIDMHAAVGGVTNEFSSDRIGSGSGKIHLETTTGGVSLHASS